MIMGVIRVVQDKAYRRRKEGQNGEGGLFIRFSARSFRYTVLDVVSPSDVDK